nr:putative f-box protein [Quercus suber]
MHANIGEQRDNWNTLLLNSINMIILTAATMAGVAATGGIGMPLLALKLSSTLLYSAATGMLLIMNKIQPSQLAEEQRNATRLFKQLQSQIQTMLAIGTPTQEDVKEVMEKVLALDKAYPLPLLGAMLEKFPAKFEPAVWWPKNQLQSQIQTMLAIGTPTQEDVKEVMEKVLALDKAYPLPLLGAMLEKFPAKFEPAVWWPKNQVLQKKNFSHEGKQCNNGWSEELEMEMREITKVVERKDIEDYVRLGNLALKINKTLAISGPLLTGIAAFGSAFIGNGSWAPIVAVAAGALASTVNAFEHGGQVGMVFEMYRNCGGFFQLLEESIEATLEEKDLEKRENGELFEMKVAMKLGRSLSQLRELARKSASSRVDEFASKLF